MNPHFEKLSAALQKNNLAGVAINPSPSLGYLTGLNFHLMERPVVLLFAPGKAPALVMPELEQAKLQQAPWITPFIYGENPSSWGQAFMNAIEHLHLDAKTIGVEPRALRLLEYNYLQAAAPHARFVDGAAALTPLRACKSQDEIAKMRCAVEIAQNALHATLPGIQIGMSEKEIAAELTIQLLRYGSESEFPFPPIVSGGPNSANPHATPSERKIREGDLLVIDWGSRHEGYIADLTRTFAVGKVDQECQEIHRLVQEANAAGRAAGKPGAACAEVDRAARGVIKKAGYGDYFTHRTGHGIGLEAHEDPYMRGDNQQLLEIGMTYTVEPGIYLPNRNGVRIEDNMVVTETGCESLSNMERAIQTIG